MITDISLRGYVVGTIWMPAVECYKPLDYSITNEQARWSTPGALRQHVLAAVNDGDFQSYSIAHGEIVVTCVRGQRRITRSFPLAHFPSVADCLHPDAPANNQAPLAQGLIVCGGALGQPPIVSFEVTIG